MLWIILMQIRSISAPREFTLKVAITTVGFFYVAFSPLFSVVFFFIHPQGHKAGFTHLVFVVEFQEFFVIFSTNI